MITQKRSAIDWLVEFLSIRLAENSGHPKDSLVQRIREGIASGRLPTENWTVEWPDGTRSPQEVIRREEFFAWWNVDGPFPITWEVWPPEIFENKIWDQINELCGRWKARSGSMSAMGFSQSLWSAEANLHILDWATKTRSIRREDFVRWYGASPFSRLPSTLSGFLTVGADDLWPEPIHAGSFAGLPPMEAIKQACAKLYPDGGIPCGRGADVKGRNNAIGDYIVERGGKRPSTRTLYSAINRLTGSSG